MAGQIEFLGGDAEDGSGDGRGGVPAATGAPGTSGAPAASGVRAAVGVPQHATRPARAGNRRFLLLGLALALIAGLAVARSVTSGGRHIAALPTPSPSQSGVGEQPGALSAVLRGRSGQALADYCAGAAQLAGATVVLPSPAGSAGSAPTPAGRDGSCIEDAAYCPQADDGLSACSNVHTVPRVVVRAVTSRFPTGRLALARTETVRSNGRLWYRQLIFALSGGTTLRVDVIQRHEVVPPSGEREDVSGRFARITGIQGTLAVLVSVAQVSTAAPDFPAMTALACDPALTALR